MMAGGWHWPGGRVRLARCGVARRAVCRHRLLLLLWVFVAGAAATQSPSALAFPSQPVGVTQGDMGGAGILQMPNARFEPVGEFSVGLSRIYPYSRLAFSIQPLPWLETTIRYTAISNRLYGATDFSGDQTYKDRGIDFKLRLWDEGPILPAVALGMRDIGGTSLFGSEYLVASRRYFNWDFTLGLGWGYMGSQGTLSNPLGHLFSSFKQREEDVGQGGTVSFGRMFHGEKVSLFAGAEYQTPWKPLKLKVELDGNDYQHEPKANHQPAPWPINIGAVYRVSDSFYVTTAFERGERFMLSLNLSVGLDKFKAIPHLHDPQPTALSDAPAMNDDSLAALVERLDLRLKQQSIQLEGAAFNDYGGLELAISQQKYHATAKAVGRVAREVVNELPGERSHLKVTAVEQGVPVSSVELLLPEFREGMAYRSSPEELLSTSRVSGAPATLPDYLQAPLHTYPAFSWGLAPALRQHVGGPDDFYFYQIWLKADAELAFNRNLSLSGELGFDIVNNLGVFKLESDSVLPHVRSDIKHYLLEGENSINQLQLDYLWKPSANTYSRISAGLFEPMFGGVGTELLYMPFGKRLALGLDLNYVKQRGFDQRFSFRDYRVLTGHLTAYYESPVYDTLAKISIGRYLARDIGVTFDFSRRFSSGISAGVFATFTDVSAEEFGEGSFDKGFYIDLPLDLLFTHSKRVRTAVVWKPLTRDGGQKLETGKALYPLIRNDGAGELYRGWSQVLD